jgi:hypothetical protein
MLSTRICVLRNAFNSVVLVRTSSCIHESDKRRISLVENISYLDEELAS